MVDKLLMMPGLSIDCPSLIAWKQLKSLICPLYLATFSTYICQRESI